MTKKNFSTRSCIFCGEPPSEKNNEHFVARWLSKFAGNDNLAATIVDADGREVKRRWSSLTLPACKACNSDYGEFEETAKPAFERLASGRIKASDTQIFLDYLDKMRVSLWLWRLYWCKKHHSINPNFHVDSRVAAHDRVLLIARYPADEVHGINPVGYSTKLFLRCPTVLGLFVKNTFLLSISSAALITDHFQMTAPVERQFQSSGKVMRRATGEFRYHPIAPKFRMQGLVFFNIGSHKELKTSALGSHILVEENDHARRMKVCEEFRVPRMTKFRKSAHALAQLNVHELQLGALNEYFQMKIPNSEALTNRVCKEELLALIRGDHMILDTVHPIILPRKAYLD